MRRFSLFIGLSIALTFPVADAMGVSYSVEYYPDNSHSTLAAGGSGPASYNLSTIPLVTSPTRVDVGGTLYDFSGEGLYRVYDGSTLVRQAIVYDGDYWRFGGHLSRLHVHATRYDGQSNSSLDTYARNGNPLSVTCGKISAYAASHLASVGVQTRQVSLVTLDPWNSYDNGHMLMEIRDPTENRWVLYDADLGAALRQNGHRLNLLDSTLLYRGGSRADLELLNSDSLLDPQFDYYAWLEPYGAPPERIAAAIRMLNRDPEETQTWYERMFQVPIINGYFAVQSDADLAFLQQHGYSASRALSPAAFRAMFYPGEPTYVPEPATMTLLAAALLAGGLMLVRGRFGRARPRAPVS